MARVLSVFPVYVSQETYDPAAIYNPHAWGKYKTVLEKSAEEH
jgi:hypothetical protein